MKLILGQFFKLISVNYNLIKLISLIESFVLWTQFDQIQCVLNFNATEVTLRGKCIYLNFLILTGGISGLALLDSSDRERAARASVGHHTSAGTHRSWLVCPTYKFHYE